MDLISRQAAIYVLHGYFDGMLETDTICPKDLYNLFEVLPSAQSEQQWIPCSERLPEESGQYLITVRYKHVDGYEDVYAEHGEWGNGKWDMFCFGHCGEVESILAWMPLPEPYKGE